MNSNEKYVSVYMSKMEDSRIIKQVPHTCAK